MKWWRVWASAGLGAVLAACGGGGGGGDGGSELPEISGTYTLALTADWAVAFSATPTVSGPSPANLSCTVRSGRLPAGVALGSACVLAGSPTEIGRFDAVLNVSAAGYRGSATANLTLTVIAPSFYAAPPVELLRVGTAITSTLPVVRPLGGRTGDQIRFAVATGRLPDGVTLDSTTGVLSGTPQAPGSFDLTLSAILQRGSATLSLTPDASGRDRLALTVEPPLRLMSFGSFCCTFVFPVAGGSTPAVTFNPPLEPGDQVTFALVSAPPRFAIDPATGVVTGSSLTGETVRFDFTAVVTSASGFRYTLQRGMPEVVVFRSFMPAYRTNSFGATNRRPDVEGYFTEVEFTGRRGSTVTHAPDGVFGAAADDVVAFELVADPAVDQPLPSWLSIDRATGVVTTQIAADDPGFGPTAYVRFLVRVSTTRRGETYVVTQPWVLTGS